MKLILIFMTIPLMLCEAQEAKKPDLGMWVWAQAAFNSAEARKELFAFCEQEKITQLDQHIGVNIEKGRDAILNGESFSKLVIEAGQKGIRVNALKGMPSMFFERNHSRVLDDLRAIIAFDKRLPEGTQLAGIKYDVEPYGTKEWVAGGEERIKVMIDYLSYLEMANALLNKEAPHLTLSVDVPLWWDNPKFNVKYKGVEKALVEHVQDLTDYIGIMSYRSNSKETLDCVQHELAYAKDIGKSICPALETKELEGAEKRISFYEKSPSEFRQALADIQQELAGNKAIKCIMIHHYKSFVKYLDGEKNKPAAE